MADRSEKERKWLMFYVKGRTFGGVVVKINTDAVKMRNQIYNRIVTRLNSVDAAIN